MPPSDKSLLKDLADLLLSLHDVSMMKYGTRYTINAYEKKIKDMRERVLKELG